MIEHDNDIAVQINELRCSSEPLYWSEELQSYRVSSLLTRLMLRRVKNKAAAGKMSIEQKATMDKYASSCK